MDQHGVPPPTGWTSPIHDGKLPGPCRNQFYGENVLHGAVDCFRIRPDLGLSAFLIEYTGRVTPTDVSLGLTSWLAGTRARQWRFECQIQEWVEPRIRRSIREYWESIMIGKLRAVLIVAGFVLIVALLASDHRTVEAAATVTRYEEVKDWLSLPPGVQLGEAAGVAVDVEGHVFVFHRPGRGFALAETAKLAEPTVLEIDANTGKLVSSWGANMFLVPHGITIDGQNNVFLTDVSLQQVFKFTHDGKLIFSLGEPRVGAWDATHFNEPTDIAIRPDGTFYVSDGYVNSRVALFDRNGQWLQEWG